MANTYKLDADQAGFLWGLVREYRQDKSCAGEDEEDGWESDEFLEELQAALS
jgi:hypothetical protein